MNKAYTLAREFPYLCTLETKKGWLMILEGSNHEKSSPNLSKHHHHQNMKEENVGRRNPKDCFVFPFLGKVGIQS